jgi:hypothetical protein
VAAASLQLSAAGDLRADGSRVDLVCCGRHFLSRGRRDLFEPFDLNDPSDTFVRSVRPGKKQVRAACVRARLRR